MGERDWCFLPTKGRTAGWKNVESRCLRFDVRRLTDEPCSCGRFDSQSTSSVSCRAARLPSSRSSCKMDWCSCCRECRGRRRMSAPNASCCQNVIRICRTDRQTDTPPHSHTHSLEMFLQSSHAFNNNNSPAPQPRTKTSSARSTVVNGGGNKSRRVNVLFIQ